MNIHNIFLYGTLKSPDKPTGWIHGDLWHLGAYPGAKNIGRSKNKIVGCIKVVTYEILTEILDRIEGVPSLYKRIEVVVYQSNGRPLCIAWVYEYARPIRRGTRRVIDGNWKDGFRNYGVDWNKK